MPSCDAIYVEYLTISNWFCVVLPALCAARKQGVTTHCYIFDTTPRAFRLARFWGDKEDFIVEQLDFQAVGIQDSQGLAVYLRVLDQDAQELQDLIIADPQFQSFVRGFQADSRVRLYLEKSQLYAYDIYGPGKYKELWHVLMMVQVIGWHARKAGIPLGARHLYIHQRPWLVELRDYARVYQVHLHNLGVIKLWRWQWNKYRQKFAKLNFRLFKALIRHALFRLKNKLSLARHRFYFTTDNPRLLTEHWGQMNLDNPQCQSDTFFIDPQGIGPQDILLVFNSSVDPLDQDKYQALHSYQMAAVALSPQSCVVDPALVPVFLPGPLPPEGPVPASSGSGSVEYKTLAMSLQTYHHARHYWRQLFERYNIKLYTDWNKYETGHMAVADAMMDVGGVSTMYQRAYEPNASTQVTIGSDIIFGFSPQGYDLEIRNRSRFDYHIAIGYVGDHRFDILRPQAEHVRQKLTSSGAKYIIAYFDENTVDDGRWFLGHRWIRENYEFWLTKLLNDPSLGIIFKPKRPISLRRRLGPVAVLLDQALVTGRCYVFESGIVQGIFPPAAAALAADLAVHDCLSAGTAGLESALAGVPTLLVDLEGWPPSPLYQLGPDVVFNNWDSVWQACRDHFRDPSLRPRLGDWGPTLQDLDPFRDGKAALRMSRFLKWMLDDLRGGKNREAVMADAAKRYAKEWGADKVHAYGQ